MSCQAEVLLPATTELAVNTGRCDSREKRKLTAPQTRLLLIGPAGLGVAIRIPIKILQFVQICSFINSPDSDIKALLLSPSSPGEIYLN